MDHTREGMEKISRRRFLGTTGALGASYVLVSSGVPESAGARPSHKFLAPPLFLTKEERDVASAIADEVFPGASDLGAIEYIENLLTAFDSSPPKLFAGGPFSGRQPFSMNGVPSNHFPRNSFPDFIPLNRFQEAAWRLRLYGSKGLPNGGPNDKLLGPVIGLREQFKKNLGAIVRNLKPGTSIMGLFQKSDDDFKMSFTELVVEGCFSAPEYGGNNGIAAWRFIHFEGDSQPLGYSLYDESTGKYRERPDAPISTWDQGPDPAPMGFLTKTILTVITLARGGKIF